MASPSIVCRLVEPPGAHRIAQRPRQQPVPGLLDHLVVLGPCRATGVEQRQVRVARDPLPPQVVVGDAGPFLEEVEQGTPVGRPVDGLGRGRAAAGGAGRRRVAGHDRLVRTDLARGVGPDRAQAVGTGTLGDRAGEGEGRRVGVVLGLLVLAADGAPRVERDAGRLELRGQGVGAGLDLEFLGGLEAVVRRERLVRPAVGEQSAVEPGVRRFVEDDEIAGVVGHLDLAERRIEQPGVPAGAPADRLVEGETALARPGQTDLLGEDGEAARDQAADPVGPRLRRRPSRGSSVRSATR